MNKKKKIIICGYARSGKDTVAYFLSPIFNSISSSEFANKLFVFPKLGSDYGYKTEQECFDDRINHRKTWFNLICEYNQQDKARLGREILKSYDCYVGCRSISELNALRNEFDVIVVWVDAFGRLPPESIESNNITIHEADYVIHNCLDKENLFQEVVGFITHLLSGDLDETNY